MFLSSYFLSFVACCHLGSVLNSISPLLQLPISTMSFDDKLLCLQDYLSITRWMKCEKQSENRRAADTQLRQMQLCQWQMIFWPFIRQPVCHCNTPAFCFHAFHNCAAAWGDLAVKRWGVRLFVRQLGFFVSLRSFPFVFNLLVLGLSLSVWNSHY